MSLPSTQRIGTVIVFRTPRLVARCIEREDAAALQEVYGDADAMRWVGDGRPLDFAQCEQWVEVSLRNYANRGYGMFALVSQETGSVIGFCGLVHPQGQSDPELKYALRRDCWGRGLATEAARAMLAAGASRFGMRRIIATTAPENAASHRVLLKAGMARGALRNNQDGSWTQLFAWDGAETMRA